MIVLSDATKTYATGKLALNGVTLTIPRHDFVFLVGPNGAGKSTLLKLIVRAEVASSGVVLVAGHDLRLLPDRKVAAFRQQIGIVFQDMRLFPQKTVLENVAFSLQVTGTPRRGKTRDLALEALELVGLVDHARRFPYQLSGGEQQRVAIARAIVRSPQILIADEPTANLPPDASWQIVQLLAEINRRGVTTLVATHDREVVDGLRRRVVELEGGHVVRDQRFGRFTPTAGTASAASVVPASPVSPEPIPLPAHTAPAARRRWPWKRSAERVLAAGLVLALMLLPSSPAPAQADTLTELTAKIKEAQHAVSDLLGLKESLKNEADSLRSATGTFTAELRRIEGELFAAVNRFRQAEARLAEVDAQIEALDKEIEEKQTAVELRAGAYATRLRALYKFSRTSPLEHLLSARDFSEALQRVTMMQAVARVDNRLLGQLRAEYVELLRAKDEMRQRQAEAAALRDALDHERLVLEARRAEQADIVTRAQLDQQSAEAGLTELDQQARAHTQTIVALQGLYQRQLEEIERQRVLEEQRRLEEARRLEEQRRASMQATVTAQATAQAAAQATARAQAARQQSSPGGSTAAAAAARAAAARAGVVPLPGSIQTGSMQPSSVGLLWPVTNPSITTEFGETNLAQKFHTGIDMAVPLNSAVRSAGDGIVLERGLAVTGEPTLSYGMMVSIAHSPTLSTLYAHLDDGSLKPLVKPGEMVKRGAVIGYIGMTGISSGPHLHFEVRVSGEPRDPRFYLPK
jgi:cell division transport system ATP-binding protein